MLQKEWIVMLACCIASSALADLNGTNFGFTMFHDIPEGPHTFNGTMEYGGILEVSDGETSGFVLILDTTAPLGGFGNRIHIDLSGMQYETLGSPVTATLTLTEFAETVDVPSIAVFANGVSVGFGLISNNPNSFVISWDKDAVLAASAPGPPMVEVLWDSFFDCNGNGINDFDDILNGDSQDTNANGVPDECEAEPSFDPPVAASTQGLPILHATGDFNGDGLEDAVVVLPNLDPLLAGNVQIFIHLGLDPNGVFLGFLEGPLLPVGLDPSDVAVGDFNDDLSVDFAVTNAGDNSVSVFLNDNLGTGTFFPPFLISSVGTEPRGIAAGEFTGDFLIDLAVANAGDNEVVILENQGLIPLGGGTILFNPLQIIPVGTQPVRVLPEDLDGDKNLDLLVPNQGSNNVSIIRGSTPALVGSGFGIPVTIPVGTAPVDVAIGDLNLNGFPDILTANLDDDTVSVIINQGTMTFDSAFAVPVGQGPQSVAVGDFDGDGDVDLVVTATDPVIGPAIQILENTVETGGGVAFEPPLSIPTGDEPVFVVTVDLNNDGLPDLVTVDVDPALPDTGNLTALITNPAPIAPLLSLDIDPGECPNEIELGKQSHKNIEVALLSTIEFDVFEVDLDSIRLQRVDGVGGEVSPQPGQFLFDDIATPFFGQTSCECAPENNAQNAQNEGGNGSSVPGITLPGMTPDGVMDLMMNFSVLEIWEILQLSLLPGETQLELSLSGVLLDGTPFSVIDCVTVEGIPAAASSNAPPGIPDGRMKGVRDPSNNHPQPLPRNTIPTIGKE